MGMFIPQLAVSIFTTHEELVNISAKGLRIVVMFFPIVGFQMVTSNFFQSIGMASKAIFLSISRQVLVLIPCLLILPRFYGQLGVWISMPISDLIASLIAGGMLWWQFRQFRKATAWSVYSDTLSERHLRIAWNTYRRKTESGNSVLLQLPRWWDRLFRAVVWLRYLPFVQSIAGRYYRIFL